MIGIIIGLVIMLADAFFIWRCCRVAGIVFTVLSVQPSAFTAICFGRTVDTFKHDKLPPDHLSIIIKDRLVREFIMLEFEVGQRIGIADILDDIDRWLSMVGKYKVITLCGSTRFKDEFMEAQKRLTLEGNIVISVGLFGHAGDAEVWENMDEGTLTKTKEMLDDMHKRKIDMADEIYVINVGGYIGSSTKSEIEYAKATGKGILYLEG